MKLSKFAIVLLTVALFGQIIFSAFYILTGRMYGGAAVDNSYLSFMMIVDIIPLIYFVRFMGAKVSKKNVTGTVLVLLAIQLIMLLEGDMSFDYPLVKSFLAYSIPAAFIGILFAKYNTGEYFAKWLEPFMLILSFVGIRSMSLILTYTYSGIGEEGVGPQSLSYYCGFAFALNLYFLLFGDEIKDRFKYARTTIYKFVCVALLVVQTVTSVSSGGRGGFVLIVVSAATLIFIRTFRRGGIKTHGYLFILLLIIVTAFLFIDYMPDNIRNAINEGSERTFSYITNKGIDMTETSSRDDVYGASFIDIAKSPIWGYGFLMKGSFIEGSWPHNLFLEVLLQGGILYLIVFLIVVYQLVKKTLRMIKSGHKLFILPLALYPIVMLCFSGSYITTGLFWFLIAYIICYEIPPSNCLTTAQYSI